MVCALRDPELESPPVKLEIVDVEKRKGLSNYYVSPYNRVMLFPYSHVHPPYTGIPYSSDSQQWQPVHYLSEVPPVQ